MDWIVLTVLGGLSVVVLLLERAGIELVLSLNSRGDIKRETRFLAQYGQLVCTVVVAVLIWQVDSSARRGLVVLGAVVATSVVAMALKRMFSRVRPGREGAGRFIGLTFAHANWRESFPSSHSACAVAFTVAVGAVIPQALPTLWALAIICALLRWVQDAHWLSDVLAGLALGYAMGHLVLRAFPMTVA